MKFLEVFFDVIPAEQDESENLVHYYWTTDENDNILLLKPRVKPNYLIDPDEYDSSEVKNKIDYIRSNNLTFHKEAYIPYTELKQYLEVEVEFKDKIKFESSMRKPLFCIRGICNKNCHSHEYDYYCFHKLPCTNSGPNWNCWSAKYPNIIDMLFDIYHFIKHCPNTNTLIVNFDFTTDEYNKTLSYEYAHSAYLVKDSKIVVFRNSEMIKQLYEEYNKNYPTEDREIESSITDYFDEGLFRFHF